MTAAMDAALRAWSFSRRLGVIALSAMSAALPSTVHAQAQGQTRVQTQVQPPVAPARAAAQCGAELEGAQRIESAHYVIAWRADPQKIPVGKHFAVDLIACPKAGAPAASSVGVDASMPAHGHGMNYKPSIKAASAERWRADGLMFHMPGQWEMVFDVRGGDLSERAKQAVSVR